MPASSVIEAASSLAEALEAFHATYSSPEERAHVRRDQLLHYCVNWQVGDYVMWAQPQRGPINKTLGRWKGPYVVIERISDHVWRIQDVISPEFTTLAHSTRLDFYSDPSLEVSTELRAIIARNDLGYEVDKLVSMRRDQGYIMLQVQWKGFTPADNTWEHFTAIYASVPRMVRSFLKRFRGDATLLRDARTLLRS